MTIYVFDTSYLVEFSDCDAIPEVRDRIRAMFQGAVDAGARFVVPLPCLFELGDHIADVKHEAKRNELAKWLLNTVESSLEKDRPWIITPAGNPKRVLRSLLSRFEQKSVKKQIGLVDTFAAAEGERLKIEYQRMKATVHLWTNDRALKGLEPDKEVTPYFW
jgi:hypothetical protein